MSSVAAALAEYAAVLDATAAFNVAAGAALTPDARVAWMALLPRWDSGRRLWLLPDATQGDAQGGAPSSAPRAELRVGGDADALAYTKMAAPKIVDALRAQAAAVDGACRDVDYDLGALRGVAAALLETAAAFDGTAFTADALRRQCQLAALRYDDAVAATRALRDDLFERRADPEYLRAAAAAIRRLLS